MSSRPDDYGLRDPAGVPPTAGVPGRVPASGGAPGGLGLRLSLWYAAVFVASTVLLVTLTYALLSSSLRQRDHEVISATAIEYASRYQAGGLPELARAVEGEERAGRHERLFVRVLGPGLDARFWKMPPEWGEFDTNALDERSRGGARGGPPPLGRTPDDDVERFQRAPARDSAAELEVVSIRFPDGSILQVGKSTEARDELLGRFRRVVGGASLLAIVIGLVGGLVLTRSTLRPINELTGVVRGIIRTGRTDARVPAATTGDAVEELSALFNVMLDRITALVTAMRDSLDHVAHDLRTPMARFRALAERALATNDPAAQREALVDAMEESDRILATLNTLMDISEAETGTLRLRHEPVSLKALAEEALELYEGVAEEKRIAMRVEGDAAIVPADRERLRRVFANLIDNAIKYTPAGGNVTVTIVDRLDASSSSSSSSAAAAPGESAMAAVRVRDTGVGLAPGDLPRIFDRLYRGDRSRHERGLGLGLSLVRAYVRAHGGDVTARSEPGQGSTFTVTLPRRAADRPVATATAATDAQSVEGGRETTSPATQ